MRAVVGPGKLCRKPAWVRVQCRAAIEVETTRANGEDGVMLFRGQGERRLPSGNHNLRMQSAAVLAPLMAAGAMSMMLPKQE